MPSPYRLAILTSHPIQYQAPLFRALAACPEVDLTVYFCSDFGLQSYHDPGFGVRLSWDVPLVNGYHHEFLRNFSPRPQTRRFWGAFNPGIVKMICRGSYDAIIVHGWALSTCWLAFAAAGISRTPIFLRGETNGLAEPTGLKALIKRVVLRPLFRATTAFLAIGSLNRKFYVKYGVNPARISSAPYSVDNAFFREHAIALLPERDDLRAREGIPRQAVVFLFCGKLSLVKRPLDVLEAFAQLWNREQCFLVYAGDGILREAIQERSGSLGLENVRITGFLNQSELPRWYALADVLVLPSGNEPWGLVTNEAMNFGLPIIVSDKVGAGPDLVAPGENGYIFPAGDIPTLKEAMLALAASATLRAGMGERSLRKIAEWGIAQTAGGYLDALHQYLRQKAEVA